MTRSPLAVYASRRTWGEFLYATLGLPLGIAGFTFAVTTLSVSAGLAVTFVGLPLLALSGVIGKAGADVIRRLANNLTGTDVAARPKSPARPSSGVARILAHLRDGAAWRAGAYLVLKLPLGILTFVVSVVFWVYGLGLLTYPGWRLFLGCIEDSHGNCHQGLSVANDWFVDTPGRIALLWGAGVVLTLAAPWMTRAVVRIDNAVMAGLLGPSERDLRVAELEHSRAVAVDDAATTLRRIERDLHDGTQARLVALAMNVGLAKEKLAEGADPTEARALLDTAHVTAKQAIAEVRDLARGIHPPVLDAGLDAALATLASHSAIPVHVHTSLPHRPDAAIETIAYFCVAELLTNAAKHSGARSIAISVRTEAGRLVVTVHDDGRGGARIGAGSGLSGLIERVRTVDGTMSVHSPAGGPTDVMVDLPMGLHA